MSPHDASVARGQIDVASAVIRLQEKKDRMDAGVREAQAEYDGKVATLKLEWLLAQQTLEVMKINLKEAESSIGTP